MRSDPVRKATDRDGEVDTAVDLGLSTSGPPSRRRFVRPDLVDLVVDRLRPGGSILVATDDRSYAERAEEVLGAHPALHGGVADRPPWRPRAGYEAKALAAGRPVVDLRYSRDGR